MHKKNKYWQLFLSTLKLSACTFGGGFVIIPLMRERFVKELHWIEEEEMLDLTAIAQSSPGSIAINASILVGYHVAGIPGALITVVGAALPPLIIISVISVLYQAFRSNRYVSMAMAGMLAGVAAVIFDVVINMARPILKKKRLLPIAVMLAAFAATRFFSVNIILIILVCGVIVVTLLLANFVVPLIAPKSETDDDDELDPEYEIEMIQNVISGLKRRQTVENKQATGRLMRMYHRRLTAARRRSVSGRQLRFLRQEVLLHQRDFIKEAIAHDEVDKRLGTTYLKRVDRMLKLLTRKKTLLTSNRQTQPLAGSTSTMRKIQDQVTSTNETRKKLEFKIDVERVAVD